MKNYLWLIALALTLGVVKAEAALMPSYDRVSLSYSAPLVVLVGEPEWQVDGKSRKKIEPASQRLPFNVLLRVMGIPLSLLSITAENNGRANSQEKDKTRSLLDTGNLSRSLRPLGGGLCPVSLTCSQ